MSTDTLLTTAAVAERLGVKVVTVQRWLQRGDLDGIDLGGRAGWRIPESALAAFLDRRTRRAEGE